MVEYNKLDLNGDIPKAMKMVMIFIDRVGFPVLAFILMFVMSYSSLNKMTQAMELNTKTLAEFAARFDTFQKVVCTDHSEMKQDLKILIRK